jgi:DNA invertase Pin-like site-specific DNA recombinase
MLVGYARVSPVDSIAALQSQNGELRAAGAAKVYGEHASATAPERPVLAACMAALGDGDTLVVTKPDRLGTLAEFVSIIVTLQRRGVGVSVLSWGLDTWDWMDHTLKPRLETLGRVVVWERALAAEIAREAAAADKHRIGRRPIATSKKAEILRLHDAGLGAGKIARRVGVGRTSVWRVVSEALAA